MHNFLTIIRKEIIHLKRDIRSLIIAFILPLSMTILYGYAISFDLKKIPAGIVAFDKSPYVREILLSLTASDYFVVVPYESTGKLYEALKEGRVKCGLVFPYNFSKDKVVKGFSEIQVLVDGSDANLAKKVQQTVQRFFIESELNVRFLYNPELKSRNFVIPGLIVVLMTMLGVILTTLSIVGEKERGNFEMLSTTPVKSHVILLGKIIPYGTIAIINVFIITGFAIIVFKVPFKGNFFILLLYSLLFLFPTLSLGAMISSYAQTELTALTTSFLSTMLPSIILSGFIFPVENMPGWLQPVSSLIPATHFLRIVRGIFLKGTAYFPKDALSLFALGVVYIFIAIRGVRKKAK